MRTTHWAFLYPTPVKFGNSDPVYHRMMDLGPVEVPAGRPVEFTASLGGR
jgi:hypothetical protein